MSDSARKKGLTAPARRSGLMEEGVTRADAGVVEGLVGGDAADVAVLLADVHR